MRPILIPLLETGVRNALMKSGVRTSLLPSPVGRLHVYDAPGRGTLPTIVLLHGLSATATPFAPVLARLRSKATRVVAVDYPGHGFSEEPSERLTVERLFEAVTHVLDDVVGKEPVVLVGNSLGGAVAVAHAVARPANVQAVVLLSPAGAASSVEEFEGLRSAFSVSSRKEAIAFMGRVYHRIPPVARLIAHEMPQSMRRRAVRELFETTTANNVIPSEELGKLTMPILLWWGRSERLLPPSHLTWWRKNLPAHAVIEEPADIGHCPHMDSPGRVTDRIVSFIQSQSPAPLS